MMVFKVIVLFFVVFGSVFCSEVLHDVFSRRIMQCNMREVLRQTGPVRAPEALDYVSSKNMREVLRQTGSVRAPDALDYVLSKNMRDVVLHQTGSVRAPEALDYVSSQVMQDYLRVACDTLCLIDSMCVKVDAAVSQKMFFKFNSLRQRAYAGSLLDSALDTAAVWQDVFMNNLKKNAELAAMIETAFDVALRQLALVCNGSAEELSNKKTFVVALKKIEKCCDERRDAMQRLSEAVCTYICENFNSDDASAKIVKTIYRRFVSAWAIDRDTIVKDIVMIFLNEAVRSFFCFLSTPDDEDDILKAAGVIPKIQKDLCVEMSLALSVLNEDDAALAGFGRGLIFIPRYLRCVNYPQSYVEGNADFSVDISLSSDSEIQELVKRMLLGTKGFNQRDIMAKLSKPESFMILMQDLLVQKKDMIDATESLRSRVQKSLGPAVACDTVTSAIRALFCQGMQAYGRSENKLEATSVAEAPCDDLELF